MPHTALTAPLSAHLHLFRHALAAGVPVAWARRQAGEWSAHQHLVLLSCLQDAERLRAGLWGHRPVLEAYTRMARLTPVVLDGLQQPGVATALRAQGVDQPARAWLDPFLAIGMEPGPGGTTPYWPQGRGPQPIGSSTASPHTPST